MPKAKPVILEKPGIVSLKDQHAGPDGRRYMSFWCPMWAVLHQGYGKFLLCGFADADMTDPVIVINGEKFVMWVAAEMPIASRHGLYIFK